MALDQNVIDKTGVGASLASVVPTLPQRQAEAWGKVRAGDTEGAALFADSKAVEEQRAKATQPIEDKLLKTAQEPLPTVKEEKIPAFEKPKIKPEDLQSAFSTLLIASMLVGASSRTPYNNAMTAMTSAMDGYMKQDEAMTAEAMKEYDKNVNTIKENNESMRREMDDNWKKNQHDLKAYELEDNIIKARYDRHLAANSDAQKSISDRVKQGENEIKQTDTAVNKQLELSQQMQIHRENLAQKRAEAKVKTASIGTPYEPGGSREVLAWKSLLLGKEPPGMGNASAAQRQQVREDAAMLGKSLGLSAQEQAMLPTDNAMKVKAADALTKWGAFVDKSSENIQLDLDNVIKLAKKIDPGTIMATNKAILSGKKQFQDGDAQAYALAVNKLNTEYIRLQQGPTSNAMLHVDAAKKADDLLGEGISAEGWAGPVKNIIDSEIINTKNSVFNVRDNLLSEVSRTGVHGGSNVKSISSDADYDALPSGSEFIDPKGVKRRKP